MTGRTTLLLTPALVCLCVFASTACVRAPGTDSSQAERTRANTERIARLPGIFLEPEDDAATRWVPPAGTPLLTMSDAGLAITTQFEGYYPRPYNDPVGFCTIGFGHLLKRSPCDEADFAEFKHGITEARAVELLKEDMRLAEQAVMALVKRPLEQNQFDALADFVFNVGRSNFRKSTLLAELNAGRPWEVPNQLQRWVKAGGKVLEGLKLRRDAESALFEVGMAVPRALEPAGTKAVQAPLDDIDLEGGE